MQQRGNENPPRLPAKDALRTVLRDNDLAGEPLLMWVDRQTLKDDLGIKALAHQYGLDGCIELLRSQSVKYQHRRAAQDAARGAPAFADYMSPRVTNDNFSGNRFSPNPMLTGTGEAQSRFASPSGNLDSPQLAGTRSVADKIVSTTEGGEPRQGMLLQEAPSLDRNNKQRHGSEGFAAEEIQADTDAKAPRQINVDSTPLTRQNSTVVAAPPPQAIGKYTMLNGRKRVTPVFVSHLVQKDSNATKQGINAPQGSSASLHHEYLKQTEHGPEEIFGVQEQHNDGREFLQVGERLPRGQQLYTARLMKHYLQTQTQTMPGVTAIAKIPYRRSLLLEGQPQFFTMFMPGQEPTLQNLKNWPALEESTHRKQPTMIAAPATVNNLYQEEQSTKHENFSGWDYLIEKYPAKAEDEDVLALYGDSGDEGEYDLETWNEIQEEIEEREHEKPTGTMAKASVASAIDEAISETVTEWQKSKMQKIQVKGYSMWMKARRTSTQQEKLEEYLHWIERYSKNVTKMREAIMDMVWHKSSEVTNSCKNMEQTIQNREEYNYYAGLLRESTAPPKPDMEAVRRAKQGPRIDVPEGEEILESDSGLSDFIEEDSDDGLIRHDPDPVNVEHMSMSTEDSFASASENVVQNGSPAQKADSDPPQFPNEVTSLPGANDEIASNHDVTMSSDPEDAIISPAKRRELTRQQAETPKRKVEIVLEASGGEDDPVDSDLDAAPRLPTSRYRSTGKSKASPVDLTLSSSPSAAITDTDQAASSDHDVHTPELNPVKVTPTKQISRLKLNGPARMNSLLLSSPNNSPSPTRLTISPPKPPSLDNAKGIRGIDWDTIDQRADHMRALAKAMYDLGKDDYNKLVKLLQKYGQSQEHVINVDPLHISKFDSERLREVVMSGIVAIQNHQKRVMDEAASQQKAQRLGRVLSLLYMTFVLHANMMDEGGISEHDLNKALEDMSGIWFRFVICLLDVIRYRKGSHEQLHGTKRKASRESEEYKEIKEKANIAELDSDDSGSQEKDHEPPSAHKKRKRAVPQSQHAVDVQKSDRARILEEERRDAIMRERMANTATGGSSDAALLPINNEDPAIFLHPHIGQRVKPHQVKGIKFMWRELVKDPKQQGCLLAHTMGLGKTMQVISLLVTIALSTKSENIDISNQIPEALRENKTLILCPPSLIDNWYDELLLWRPDSSILGQIYKINSGLQPLLRRRDIALWASGGGILIIGYEMFRDFVLNPKKKLPDDVAAEIEEHLLQSPRIVIADEAHKMKSAGAKITQVAQRFRTPTRVALTGSPLANNLEEYHTMVDWIAPGYLGTMVQFKAKYSEPISRGLYYDSTSSEKRHSLRRLHTLKRDLDPKIDRADITAIEADMPAKTEFYITLPLTKPQIKAYNICVTSLLQSNSNGANITTASLFQWLHVLSLLINHPSCFVSKLDQAAYSADDSAEEDGATNGKSGKGHKKGMAGTDESQGDAIPADVTAADLGFSTKTVQRALAPFRKLEDEGDEMESPEHSHRARVVQQIVEESMAIGHKVLIFSHTIPTLNYLEGMLKSIHCKTCRIDGTTKMSSRQEATKNFNKKDSQYQCFLISMKAGGLGLNLQGANRVIIYDFGFNPTWEDQAIGRAYRLGQERPVFVYRFRAGGTFEEVLYNKAVFKTQLFSRVVDKKNYMSQATKSIDKYLFEVKDVRQHDFSEAHGKDHVLDRIISREHFFRNVELTETFQKEDEDELAPEELQLAEQEYEDQRLERENPAAFNLRIQKRKAAAGLAQPLTQQTGAGPHPMNFAAHRSFQVVQQSNSTASPTGQVEAHATDPNERIQTGCHYLTSPSQSHNQAASPYFQQAGSLFAHQPPQPTQPSSLSHTWSNGGQNPPMAEQPPRASSMEPKSMPQLDGADDQPDEEDVTKSRVHQECGTQ